MKNFLLILFILFLNRKAFALVDYSDTETSNFKPRSAKKAPARSSMPMNRASKVTQQAPKRGGGGPSFLSMMEFSTSYQTTSLELANQDASVGKFNFEGMIQTPYNFFVGFSYGLHSSDNDFLAPTASSQKGNAQVLLGLNWLSFGGGADLTTIDFIAGVRAGEEDSYFATSRNDKTVALETTKTFYNFILGLGYEITMTGAPKTAIERDIGNISRIYTKLGFVVSQDIKFLISADHITISDNSDSTHGLTLNRELSYGVVSPKLILGISPLVNLQLGGIFRTKRLEDIDSLTSARLFHLDGVYGNSLLAGLNINL